MHPIPRITGIINLVDISYRIDLGHQCKHQKPHHIMQRISAIPLREGNWNSDFGADSSAASQRHKTRKGNIVETAANRQMRLAAAIICS